MKRGMQNEQEITKTTVFASNCKNSCSNDVNATDHDAHIFMCSFLHNDSPRGKEYIWAIQTHNALRQPTFSCLNTADLTWECYKSAYNNISSSYFHVKKKNSSISSIYLFAIFVSLFPHISKDIMQEKQCSIKQLQQHKLSFQDQWKLCKTNSIKERHWQMLRNKNYKIKQT